MFRRTDRSAIALAMSRAASSRGVELSRAQKQILDLYRAQNHAMIDADTLLLDGILDDGFVAIHINGHRQSKSESLEQIRSLQVECHHIEEQTVRVTVAEDEAVLETTAIVDATISGSRASWPLHSRTTLGRISGRWLATGSRAILRWLLGSIHVVLRRAVAERAASACVSIAPI